jgi:DNA-binding winged helix-turn-helix (wHTH) protein/Tfp pilus assembly protein PilF
VVSRISAAIVADDDRPNLQEALKRYAIGPFELDAARHVLSLAGEPLALGPRVVDTLTALVERAGAVVTKEELLDRVWAREDVGESNVAQSVYTLRKMLREHGLGDAIATVQRRGYRFTARVELVVDAPRTSIPVQRHAVAASHGALVPPNGARVWTNRGLTATLALILALLAAVPAGRAVSRAPLAVHHAPPLSARGAELYRLGRYFWNLRTPSGLAKSAGLFAAVVASDPRNPLGYAGQADADLMMADYRLGRLKPARYLARARAEIRTALALDRDSAAAHTSLAMLRFAADHDSRGSDAEFRRALALDPGYAIAHHWYGTTLFRRGRLADASRELRAAITLEPVSAATGGWLAEASYFSRRYADAIVYARLALDLDPHRGGALRRLGLAYELAGDVPHAIETFERLRRTGPEAADAPALLAEAYARAGRRDAARAALREAIRVHPNDSDTAFAMLALGDRARGLAILHRMPKPAPKYASLMDPRIDPFLAALHLSAARAGSPT